MKRTTVIALGGMFGAICAVTLAARGVADAVPKVAVCHFDNDGIPSPPVTLMVGNQNAADKHVANHNTLKGHEGNDSLGSCVQ